MFPRKKETLKERNPFPGEKETKKNMLKKSFFWERKKLKRNMLKKFFARTERDLKGQSHEIFCIRFFFTIQLLLVPLEMS